MPSFNENIEIETSSIQFSKTGIRLLKFITIAFGRDVLSKLKKSELVVLFNGRELKYNENFRKYRVKEDTDVKVIRDEGYYPIPQDMFSF
jgi:hypothetical protein